MSPNYDENTHHNSEWHIVMLLGCQILVTPSAPLLCYTHHVVVKDRAVAGNVMLFGCQIMVTPSAPLLCYTHHVIVKDRAVAGIVMLFGCYNGHAIGVFVVLYTTCCCERPCCSWNRHAIWSSYWSRHGRLCCVIHNMLLWRTVL